MNKEMFEDCVNFKKRTLKITRGTEAKNVKRII